MIKVTAHGDVTRVQNPQSGVWQEMIPVTTIETSKRSGGNADLSESSNELDEYFGEETGLQSFRTHTQLVKREAVARLFPIGTEIKTKFINRKLFSQAQMKQQTNVDARMIDGNITYFSTYISSKELPDIDLRLERNIAAQLYPDQFKNARVGAAITERFNEADNSWSDNRAWNKNSGYVGQNVGSTNQQVLESASLKDAGGGLSGTQRQGQHKGSGGNSESNANS